MDFTRLKGYLIQDTIDSDSSFYTAYSMSGIPTWAYPYDSGMDKLHIKKPYQKIYNDYVDDIESMIEKGTSIIIYADSGLSGTGKSTAQYYIAMKAVSIGYTGLCFYYSDLLALFREFLVNAELKMLFKRWVQQVDFVAIDAFGSSGYSVNKEYVISGMSDLVYYLDNGSAHRIPLFVSSVIQHNIIEKLMDKSAYSKLYANHVFVELAGTDIRIK